MNNKVLMNNKQLVYRNLTLYGRQFGSLNRNVREPSKVAVAEYAWKVSID